MGTEIYDTLTHKIIGCCYEVHRELGPGFLEKIYSRALIEQFTIDNINFECEKEFNVFFKNKLIGKFRCDFYIEGKVILEIKSVTGIQPQLFQTQLISYLKASKIKTGLLVNFGNGSCDVKRLSV
ncbi:GxxExxY protein [Pedobacter sp. SD-b]|uniref:GxxExxY protein n=1 Tax=Pedobacter segetis TaxID=2793069 RepID=A0ABS1BKI6_9SPHI|nr:GxxExxY protein [Pedobacter segetis]MBK0383405.1 GxxExxY protein [Pedobacter segetis]